jgi:dTDP-glucose 4,6-dehydratase
MTFEEGLLSTIQWYLKNHDWIENIKSGTYKDWIQKNYSGL